MSSVRIDTYEMSGAHCGYRFDAPSYTAALAMITLLGEGQFGLACLSSSSLIALPAHDWPEQVYRAAGLTDAHGLMQWIDQHDDTVALVLDSLRVIGQHRGPDLLTKARGYAQALRNKRTFASVDGEQPQ